MDKELMKGVMALAVVVLIAYVVAKHVSRNVLLKHKQNAASRTWQPSIAVAPMADEAFVNNYRR